MASAKFSTKQRVFIIDHWIKPDHDYALLVIDYKERFPNTRLLESGYAQRLYQKFLSTGMVNDKPRSSWPRTSFTDANLEIVAYHFTEHSCTKQRHSARQLQIKISSSQRLMKARTSNPIVLSCYNMVKMILIVVLSSGNFISLIWQSNLIYPNEFCGPAKLNSNSIALWISTTQFTGQPMIQESL